MVGSVHHTGLIDVGVLGTVLLDQAKRFTRDADGFVNGKRQPWAISNVQLRGHSPLQTPASMIESS